MSSKLEAVVKELGITAHAVPASKPPNATFGRDGTNWTVTLKNGNKRLTTPFHQGSAHKNPPNAAGVLYCLVTDLSSAGMTFAEFCNEFGYEHDPYGKCEGRGNCGCKQVWKAIEKSAPKTRAFLGADLSAIEEACQDY